MTTSARSPLSPDADTDPDAGTEAGFRKWVNDFRPRALSSGITPATYDRAMSIARYNPEVIRLDRRQAVAVPELPGGELGYTRAGNFSRSPDGLMITSEGYQVMPGITIPEGATSITVLQSRNR